MTRLTALRPLACLVLLASLVAGCSGEDPTPAPAPTPGALTDNPFAQRALYVAPSPRLSAAAAQAAADGDDAAATVLTRLTEVPTGIWLTPERLPAGQVGPYVADTVASSAGRTVPLFVVYGVPDRDCTGQLSAGGLDADTYLPWVQEIAAAAGDQAAVVLEPDALPSAVQCSGRALRLRLLAAAVDAFAASGTPTYVDAGHSDWIPASRMAGLLRKVGIDEVRGFSTNVSNYQPEDLELSYASRLSGLVGGAHYVIDTGRNGDPSGTGAVVTQWCNPRGRALGDDPGFVDDGSGLDALLWIKPPAESDGTCGGGPPAGEVWITRAVNLGIAAGW